MDPVATSLANGLPRPQCRVLGAYLRHSNRRYLLRCGTAGQHATERRPALSHRPGRRMAPHRREIVSPGPSWLIFGKPLGLVHSAGGGLRRRKRCVRSQMGPDEGVASSVAKAQSEAERIYREQWPVMGVDNEADCPEAFLNEEPMGQRGEPKMLPEESGGAPGQRYRSFQMKSCEFLVAESDDGLLQLCDTYMWDPATEKYSRPDMEGTIPDEYRQYRVLEWQLYDFGDVMKEEDPDHKTLSVYLVRELSLQPYAVDMFDVYKLDGEAGKLVKEVVKDKAGPDATDPVLRIRPEGLTVEDNDKMPTHDQIIITEGLLEMLKEHSSLLEDENIMDERWQQDTEEEEEFDMDEFPDVPEVDLA
eukprot:evm.model.scf_209.2 EVM.evm.TU.scf_209.2   scf_209:6760-7845(-)